MDATPATNHLTVSERLSARELEVLAMTARGLTNLEVGTRLHLSVHAVKFHLASVYRKLNVTNRTEAAVAYLQSLNSTTHGSAEV